MAKRIFDLVIASLLAVPSALVIVLAAFVVWLETRSDPIFRQIRVGKNQVPFTLYKLRTMSVGTLDVASHEVSPSQITRSGRFFRRLKIDELPQLFCVLKGDMSLVGPRPCLPTQSRLIAAREHRNVFHIRPGITGTAQIRGIDMATPELLALVDEEYLRTASLILDLKILLRTLTGQGRGDAVLS